MKQQSRLQSHAIESDIHATFDAIRKIVQALRQSSKSSEKDLGLSAAQLFVLQKIAESERPPSINDLAVATMTHQSSVSVVVSKLVLLKLASRVRSRTDSRAVELKLSRRGEALLLKSPQPIQERIMSAVADMSPAERRGLVQGLRALIQKAALHEAEPSLFFEDSQKSSTRLRPSHPRRNYGKSKTR